MTAADSGLGSKRKPPQSRRFPLGWALPLAALAGIAASHSVWLPFFAHHLIESAEPAKSDAIFVLAGDLDGRRILKAAELGRQGYAPVIYASGPTLIYGLNEGRQAVDMAVRAGYPESMFRVFESESDSTRDEAHHFSQSEPGRRMRTLLLVTSEFHTRRAGDVFRRAFPSVQIRVVPAATRAFDPDTWWKQRRLRKLVLLEWMKTVADWARL